MPNRTTTLTEREKEVLRHVQALRTSAQIAHELRIAEVSVNKRIDSARRKLGGISRRQAALLLAEEEGQGYENLIPSEIVLIEPGDAMAEELPDRVEDATGGAVSPGTALSREGRRNAYDIWQRIGLILLTMAVLLVTASLYLQLLRR